MPNEIYYYKTCTIQKDLLKEAEFIFKELSSGVYQTLKDSPWELNNFVKEDVIVDLLNTNKVYVVRNDSSYSNFKTDLGAFTSAVMATVYRKENSQ